MILKNFKLNCILRVLLITATISLSLFLIFNTSLIMVPVILAVAAAFQVYCLIRYIDKSNEDLIEFLETLKYSDFSISYPSKGRGKLFDKLSLLFREVSERFQSVQVEKEEQYRYLQSVIEHLEIGLVSFFENGDVDFINPAAKRLLGISRLKNIHHLETLSEKMTDLLLKLDSGEKDLVKIEINDDPFNLMVHIKKFKLRGRIYTLAALYNIQKELEEKELESWQNLIKVLTHEIMNSVTPIVSLSSTAKSLIESSETSKDDKSVLSSLKKLNEFRDALQTIQKRSEGLLHFVNNYRNFLQIPKPSFQILAVSALFDRVRKLMQDKIERDGIKFTCSLDPETLDITCDPALMEQVLINLLLNSIWAVKDHPNPAIELKGTMDERGRVIIELIDNGIGISDDLLDKIFMPFFTTRRDGSGVGLSISKQIIRLHHGTISVRSNPGGGATFRLKF